jgi:hypothetical protein
MVRAVDIASVERATGKAWRDWVAFLERIGTRICPTEGPS